MKIPELLLVQRIVASRSVVICTSLCGVMVEVGPGLVLYRVRLYRCTGLRTERRRSYIQAFGLNVNQSRASTNIFVLSPRHASVLSPSLHAHIETPTSPIDRCRLRSNLDTR